jgi:hypothetical protein
MTARANRKRRRLAALRVRQQEQREERDDRENGGGLGAHRGSNASNRSAIAPASLLREEKRSSRFDTVTADRQQSVIPDAGSLATLG